MSNKAAAQFTGTLKTSTFPNVYNVVVPVEGPFYRAGLELTTPSGRELIEGLDYYLGFYFQEAAEALKDQIYGGIILLAETEINYSIYSVGREYRVPQSEIGKYLVGTTLVDPRNTDWSELMSYAPVVAPIDPPSSLEEAILRDEVVKALDDIRLGILARAADMDVAYSEVTDLIFQNGKKIFEDNLYQHHLIKNAHEYTAEEVGALKVLGKAVDATKAFGKSIDELVDIMKTNGISQTHIDTLMPVVLGELRGRLRVINNGALTFRTADSSHVITLQGDKFLITTTKPITIAADSDNNDPGIAVEMSSGLNAMYVASGADAPIFNGAYLITPEMVSLYLTAVKLMPANAFFSSTDTLKIFGSGKAASPVNMTAVVPTATATVPGLILITSVSSTLGAGAAISQKAVSALKTSLDGFVDTNYTVNGKPFVISADKQELTLTATDLGVQNMDNTSPTMKPLTTAIINALSQKALANHTHVIGDLTGVPVASDTVYGLLQLWDAIDTTTNKVVTSKQGYNVQQRINTLRSTINGLLPDWTTGGSVYGNSGYLPVQAVGSYEGYSRNIAHMQGAAKLEGDVVYALINCHSGTLATARVYYAYGGLDANNNTKDLKKTTYRYHPAGMTGKYPGVYLQAVLVSGKDGLVGLGSDNKYYLVPFNGTLNAAKHTTVCEVQFPAYDDGTGAEFIPDQSTDTLAYDGTNFILVRANLMGNQTVSSIYRVGCYTMKASTLNATRVTATQMDVGFSRKAGKCADLVEPGMLDGDATTQRLAWITPAAAAIWTRYFETTRGIGHHVTAAVRDGKLRVGTSGRATLYSYTASRDNGTWSSAFDIDLATNALTLVTDIFPLRVDVDGLWTRDNVLLNNGAKWTGRNSGYVITNHVDTGDGRVVTYHVSNETARVPALDAQALPAGTDFFDFLGQQVTAGVSRETPIPDGRGSVYGPSMTAPLFFPGTQKLWTNHILTTECVEAEYVVDGSYNVPGYGGFGPTNNRRTIDYTAYAQMAKIPLVAGPGALANGALDGAHFVAAGSQPYKVVAGTTVATADRLTISAAEWATMKQKLIDAAQAGQANGYAQERITEVKDGDGKVFTIDLWIVGTTLTGGPMCIAIVSTVNYVTDRNYLNTYFFQVTPTITNGTVSFATATANQFTFRINLNGATTDIRQTNLSGGRTGRVGQASLVTFDNTRYRLSIPLAVSTTSPAASVGTSFALSLTRTGGVISGNVALVATTQYITANFSYEAYVPDLGAYARLSCSLDPAFLAGDVVAAEPLVNNTTTVLGQAIVSGEMTAEGWNLYMAEEVDWRIGSTYYVVPVWSLDLKATFPDSYKGQVFYMHVGMTNNVPSYRLLTSRQPETDTLLYLGTVVTDDSRILEIDINKVKRIGNLKQITEHAGVAYSHDVDVESERRLSPLGLLKKEQLLSVSDAGGSYLDAQYADAVVAKQKRLSRKRAIVMQPKVTALASLSNKAYLFWPAVITTAASSVPADNTDANTNGCVWVGSPPPRVLAAPMAWHVQVPVTPTKGTIRVRVWFPNTKGTASAIGLKVNGTALPAPVNNANTAITITTTANQLQMVSIEAVQLEADRTAFGNKVVAYAIYDVDGTTETPLVVSGADTRFLIDPYDAVGYPGNVFLAEDVALGASSSDYTPLVSTGLRDGVPPVIVNATTATVVTKWRGYRASMMLDTFSINLMPKLN